MDESYEGPERRTEYCPVHHIKCKEWNNTQESVKQRVPIWVFRMFLAVLIVVIGAMNVSSYRDNQDMLVLINDHIQKSNTLLTSIMHTTSETASNQRRVMSKIELEFQKLPHYGID